MELLYLYIKRYDDIFENQEINFSLNYRVEYTDGRLNIEKKDNNIKNYYGDKVETVTMVHGKNGTGKSTLLDLLGMRIHDRRGNSNMKQEKISYFLMYHLYDNYFGFEFSDSSYIVGSEKITNIDMHGKGIGDSLYKPWVGLIFLLKDKNLIYETNFFKRWLERNDKNVETIYAYITEDKYNSRVNNDSLSEDDGEYIFARKYYMSGIRYEYLYRYLIYMKNKDGFHNFNKKISVKNIIKDEIRLFRNDMDDETENYLNGKIDELNQILNNDRDLSIFGEEQAEEDNKKESFLKKFYIELIEYYFLNRLCDWIWNRELEFRKIDILKEEYKNLIAYIETQGENQDIEEYISILKYVLEKVDAEAERTVQTNEWNAILDILKVIQELPEEYFRNKRTISIDCKDVIDRHVLKLLSVYDGIYKQKDIAGNINTIDKVLQILPPEMSEGQRVFLDIISKTVLAVNEAKKGDNVVLLIDEPDRAIHPELARNFIDILLRNLNHCEDRTIQVVLSSHSPFIVTDILPEGVYAITREDNESTSIIEHKKDTFATNIYYLLMDTFMLKNTFGKYSYDKIKNVVKKLKDEELEDQDLNSIKSFIDKIGEKTVRKKLLELYYAKDTRYEEKHKVSQRILDIEDEEKFEKIKRILDE